MRKYLRAALIAVLVVSSGMATAQIGRADIDDADATNLQEGDNRSTGTQSGRGSSGDAVGGQVTGVVSSGRTSVDATNRSVDSDVSTGDASGTNSAGNFTGLNAPNGGNTTIAPADITNSCVNGCNNVQEGDNRSTMSQSATATTGDGVAGEVIGVVTAAGGSASVVAANRTVDSSVETGDADANNDAAAFVGLVGTFGGDITVTAAADIEDTCNGGCFNLQEGDNRGRARQTARAATGDGVGGQVIGVVSGGATSVDATNSSEGVDVNTGDADSNNDAALFVGLLDTFGGNAVITAADIVESCTSGCANVQEGDNRGNLDQSATATTGDGVAGGVIGVVTSAGGSASVVAANRSVDSDVSTGDSDATNDAAAFVGLLSTGGGDATVSAGVADIEDSCIQNCANLQEGDNRFSGSQSANAATGDGVAGQVLGVVSAGAASVDATNLTRDSSAETGDADATNDASEFVGLAATFGGDLTIADIDNVSAANVQEGDNSRTFRQSATADSGDAVAGQVSGVVTSAGGSASVVLANTSEGIDASTGDGDFSNDEDSFVGHSATDGGDLFIGLAAAGVLD